MEKQPLETPVSLNSSKKKSIKHFKAALFVLAGVAAFALVALYFLLSYKENEPQSASDKLGSLYFSTLPLKKDPYPFIVPKADDFTRDEWISLISYYKDQRQDSSSKFFHKTEVGYPDTMESLAIEKSQNGQAAFMHYFYLEALCRIKEDKVIESLFKAYKSPNIDAFRPRDSIICLLRRFKNKLSTRDIRAGLIHSMYNPCVTDENIISLNIMNGIESSVASGLAHSFCGIAYNTNRVKVFEYFSEPFLKSMTESAESKEKLRNFAATLANPITKPNAEKLAMIKKFLLKVQSEDVDLVCQVIADWNKIDWKDLQACKKLSKA